VELEEPQLTRDRARSKARNRDSFCFMIIASVNSGEEGKWYLLE
jgi:hypothetical protein